MTIIIAAVVLVAIVLFFANSIRRRTPSEQWPLLAPNLKLGYEDDPARMTGDWVGRHVQVLSLPASVSLTMWLKTPTRLRVECGPKDAVAKRPGYSSAESVAAVDAAFRDKFLARCSEKNPGAVVFDGALQIRLSDMPRVDFVGSDQSVIWTLPDLKDQAEAESIFGALRVIVDSLERFPFEGATHGA
jgi:hypothetical protein